MVIDINVTFVLNFEDVMRGLEWDNDGVKINVRQLHHLTFADDIVLITSSISQVERIASNEEPTLIRRVEKLVFD